MLYSLTHDYCLLFNCVTGGLSIAVPGELRGFEYAWERFGVLSWEELFEPAIRIATDGIAISKTVADAIAAVETDLLSGNYEELKYVSLINLTIMEELS